LINAVASRLVAHGWRLTFLSAASPQETEEFRTYASKNFPGSETLHIDELLNDLSVDEDIPLWGFHFFEYFLSYRIALALRKLCKKVHFDGIEFNDFPGLGYVTLKWRRLWGDEFAEVPIWIRLHGSHELWDIANDSVDYSAHRQMVYRMERYCLQYADGWIGPSESVMSWYRKAYNRPEVATVVSMPSFERIGTGNTHPRLRPNGTLKILYFGKLQHLKGVDIFIRAAVAICEQGQNKFEFEIVGMDTQDASGRSYIASLEKLIPTTWRERFHFRGYLPLNQMTELINCCTLAVVPSRVETFCLAAHELNWIGIPLVLSDIPAFEEYFVDHVNCLKFDGTPEGLYRVLVELFGQQDLFSNWDWNAPEIINRERLAKAYSEVLHEFHAPELDHPDTSEPLVSIVIPYYDMHRYIDDTIDSVIRSDYHNWEMILVDDGSPSIEAQEKFAKLELAHHDDPKYKFMHKRNGGLGCARNFGIRQARGKYILPLDCDDIIDPYYIALGVKALERRKDLASVSCFVSYFNDERSAEEICDYVIPYDLNPLLITLENRAGVACSLFRREVFERFSYNEELTAFEDWELWWQMAEAGLKSETMPKILYRYRRHQASMFNQTSPTTAACLMNHIASLHTTYLRNIGDDVFRLYVAALAKTRVTEQQLHAEISENNPNSAIINQLYTELNTIKDSFTWKLIGKFRRLRLYHWMHPLYMKLKYIIARNRHESVNQ
jgi:glycosyltransferase involved in cell wall biosynthesis